MTRAICSRVSHANSRERKMFLFLLRDSAAGRRPMNSCFFLRYRETYIKKTSECVFQVESFKWSFFFFAMRGRAKEYGMTIKNCILLWLVNYYNCTGSIFVCNFLFRCLPRKNYYRCCCFFLIFFFIQTFHTFKA